MGLEGLTPYPRSKILHMVELGLEPRSFWLQSIWCHASMASKTRARKEGAFDFLFLPLNVVFLAPCFLGKRARCVWALIFDLSARKVLTPLNICLYSRVIATNDNASHWVGTAVGYLANMPSVQRLSHGTAAWCCWGGWIHSWSVA